MKKLWLVAALAAGIAWLNWAGRPTTAQPMSVPAVGGAQVAFLDVNAVFKRNIRFNAELRRFQQDSKTAEAEWKRENDEITKQAQQIRVLLPGTPERKQKEEETVGLRSRFQARVTIQKKAAVQREARLYYDAYQEIRQVADAICQAHNIGAVVNFSSDPINPDNPDDVFRGVNQKVVTCSRNFDITGLVADRINQAVRQADGTSGPPQPGVPYR